MYLKHNSDGEGSFCLVEGDSTLVQKYSEIMCQDWVRVPVGFKGRSGDILRTEEQVLKNR